MSPDRIVLNRRRVKEKRMPEKDNSPNAVEGMKLGPV
jgi:hypothetical protein